ncbi:MAG: arsenate reductase ArsC [Azospirillaceae bacterium]|nr:arsenate reductase ArsC [Azospirillaceae bacterium]
MTFAHTGLPAGRPLPPPDRHLGVLFVGRVNAGRSVMAEAMLRHHADHRFEAYSAGLAPAAALNPHILARLRAEGIATSGLAPTPLDRFMAPDAPAIDIIITVSALAAEGLATAWPGRAATAHWDLPNPDPALFPGDDLDQQILVEAIFHDLRRRIDVLAALPTPCLLALSQWDLDDDDGDDGAGLRHAG